METNIVITKDNQEEMEFLYGPMEDFEEVIEDEVSE